MSSKGISGATLQRLRDDVPPAALPAVQAVPADAVSIASASFLGTVLYASAHECYKRSATLGAR